MASPIASIPVLTGEVAQEFEAQANKTYNEYLKRVSCQEGDNADYEQGIQMVRSILATSGLR